MAVVILPRSFVELFAGLPRRIEVPGGTVGSVIDALEERIPGARDRLLEAGPAIRTHINVYVDGERAALDTAVPDDATVHVIPAVSGG